MKNTSTSLRFFSLLLLILFYTHVNAGVWTITSNADSGVGTLRAALNPTTGASAGDVIYFSGPMTITIASTLSITQGVTIDATVGTGWSPGNNKVTIVGTGSVANGISLGASGITIKGLTIQNFATNCMIVSGGPNFNIKSCFFNTNSTGTVANASAISQAIGIYVSGASSGGIVGGPAAGDGNVFYTAITNRTCLDLSNVSGMSASTKITVQGNKFGTDYTGTVNFGLGNNSCGVQCSYMTYVDIGGLAAGQGNQFDGSTGGGKAISFGGTAITSNITVQGNKIGTVAGNSYGIFFNTGSYSNITIQNNVINNSANYGIDMSGATPTQVKISQNTFSNNTSGAINNAYTPPTISYATPGKIGGTGASAGATVEIFSWDGLTSSPQGSTFIASVTADASGNWFYYGSFSLGQKLVVNSTPVSGTSTTRFTGAFTVASCPTTVNAGLDQNVCATSSSVAFTGSTNNGTNPGWTIVSGLGSLSGAGTLSPTYTPSATEQSSSSNVTVTLQFTVTTATCAATISDQVNLTINPKPTAGAGSNQNLCANASGAVLNGVVTNGSGSWSGGSGTFSPNANTLNATYVPAVGERITGTTIPLTLTATGVGSCMFATSSSTMVITVTAAPTINVGADQTVCANSFPVSTTASITVATGVTWSGGSGSYAPNATALTMSYQPTTQEKTNGTVTLTATTTGNGTCLPVSDSKVFTITPAPTANAGADKSTCVPAGSISLAGSVTVATGGQWSTTGSGTLSNATSLTGATYTPSSTENTTASAQNITFTLTTSGNGTCNAVTDQMILTLTPAPVVNAGSDLTICSNNTNVSVGGSVTGAPTKTWTSSGSGTFTNLNTVPATYTPSSADKAAGSVTLTLTASGAGCAPVSDVMVLNITTCLLSPNLTFDTPNLFKTNGSAPFKHTYTTNSAGAISYTIKKASNAAASSCATVDASGYITLTCVDTLKVSAYQAAKGAYSADTAYYTLYVGKAVTKIELESRGGMVSDTFRLKVTTNYDQPLTYSIIGGDFSAATISSDGLITALAVGSVYVTASAAGDANYQSATSSNTLVTIYPNLTKPVAVNDTLHMLIAEQKTIRLADNDYGTTASINLSPMLIDIDSENPGLQTKYFKPGIGIFTIDTTGLLTFSAFEAFIGKDSIQYTVTDANGLVSNKASLVLYVTSPVAEIAMKANEIITANGDNLNNALVIGYTDLTQSNDLLIVDAAGNKLFYKQNYQNDWSATDSSGNNLGNGVYYFIFREFDHAGTVRRQLKGDFTVLR